MPGGKPLIELPGPTPTSEFTIVGPVLVTAEPARTPKFFAVPRTNWAFACAEKRKHAADSRRALRKLERTRMTAPILGGRFPVVSERIRSLNDTPYPGE